MAGMTVLKRRANKQGIAFTMVEMLTVMAIIAILAALTLAAGSGMLKKAGRNRASTEIQGMSTGLESYKADNGAYPIENTAFQGEPYPLDPTPSGGAYQTSSEALFQALSGITNYATDTLVSGTKSYVSFKSSQIGNPTGPSYVIDPWGNSYGYSTANPSYNGTNSFDLWSTGGTTKDTTANPNATNTWISNWQ